MPRAGQRHQARKGNGKGRWRTKEQLRRSHREGNVQNKTRRERWTLTKGASASTARTGRGTRARRRLQASEKVWAHEAAASAAPPGAARTPRGDGLPGRGPRPCRAAASSRHLHLPRSPGTAPAGRPGRAVCRPVGAGASRPPRARCGSAPCPGRSARATKLLTSSHLTNLMPFFSVSETQTGLSCKACTPGCAPAICTAFTRSPRSGEAAGDGGRLGRDGGAPETVPGGRPGAALGAPGAGRGAAAEPESERLHWHPRRDPARRRPGRAMRRHIPYIPPLAATHTPARSHTRRQGTARAALPAPRPPLLRLARPPRFPRARSARRAGSTAAPPAGRGQNGAAPPGDPPRGRAGGAAGRPCRPRAALGGAARPSRPAERSLAGLRATAGGRRLPPGSARACAPGRGLGWLRSRGGPRGSVGLGGQGRASARAAAGRRRGAGRSVASSAR